MRSFFVVVAMLSASWLGAPEQESGCYSINLVRISLQLPGVSTGSVERQIHRMGDRLAINLIKVLSDDDLRDARMVRRSLALIRESFTYPRVISVEEDRQPKVTLLFLNYVLEETPDSVLKEEISQAIQFVKQQTVSTH